ncbi:MAG TPA: hypothetical protein VJP80_02730 [Candidatus Saccharimonadales bacterium]|nr:hypothetical protein [Candidatus Saccharimonadales bacterium]
MFVVQFGERLGNNAELLLGYLARESEQAMQAELDIHPLSNLDTALEDPQQEACCIGDCAIRGVDLQNYILSYSQPDLIPEIDQRAAASCLIHEYLAAIDATKDTPPHTYYDM